MSNASWKARARPLSTNLWPSVHVWRTECRKYGESGALQGDGRLRDASQRRVMYLPLMNGPEKLKDESSPTPFSFRLRKLAGY